MKLYPYTPNPEAVRKHFIAMAEGKLDPQIGRGYTSIQPAVQPTMQQAIQPTVQLVTPAAMAVEQAKSSLQKKPPVKRNSIKRKTVKRKSVKRKSTKTMNGKKQPIKHQSTSRIYQDNFS